MVSRQKYLNSADDASMCIHISVREVLNLIDKVLRENICRYNFIFHPVVYGVISVSKFEIPDASVRNFMQAVKNFMQAVKYFMQVHLL